MTTLIILISIYVLSALGSYKATQLEYYNPEGKMHGCATCWVDILQMVYPILNTFHAFSLTTGSWKEGNNTFFKPRKPYD